MDNIVVFSKYAERAPGFGISMHKLIEVSMANLGIQTTFISDYEQLYNITNSVVLFLVKPSIYLSHIHKTSETNTNIIWNFEPFSFSHSGDKKLDNFRYIFGKLLSNKDKYRLKHIWFFDKRQSDLFNNTDCSYLPIGYDPVLSSRGKYKKKNKDKLLFIGKIERERRKDFKAINKLLRSQNISIQHINHSRFTTLENNIDLIYGFRFGLNHHDRQQRLHTHWHRIMVYAANKVSLVSQDDLTRFGFINGKHYIYYKRPKDIANIYFGDYELFKDMSRNMLEKVQKEYYMTDLLSAELGKIL